MTPEDGLKACCAAAYSGDVVCALLGDSYHPGGGRLTRRLVDSLAVRPGERVLDVACGRGSTALLLAGEYGVRAHGIDYSVENAAVARAAAQGLGLAQRAAFASADAERLPYPDAAFDVVVCECALCTFPDKVRAVAEFARVLRPGGRLGLADVTVEPGQLGPELSGLGARIACLGDALPLHGYVDLLTGAGLRTVLAEPHQRALLAMVDRIEARLALLRMTAPGMLSSANIDPSATTVVLAQARRAVAGQTLGYALVIAHKDGQRSPGRRPS
ncbi:class I SAM-dependent methyltransferase [Streptomyces sp. NPDC006879]|uniref:class I SAM-dependent methyltransferase n=1 Tax=Streptomyces sp. NPDC006879 TaxID=3364767 RepID=UPI0036767DF0